MTSIQPTGRQTNRQRQTTDNPLSSFTLSFFPFFSFFIFFCAKISEKCDIQQTTTTTTDSSCVIQFIKIIVLYDDENEEIIITEKAHHIMPKESILAEVLSASVGGAFSASALYPLEVLKTKMQAKSNDNDDSNDGNGDDNESNEMVDDVKQGTSSNSTSSTSSDEGSDDLEDFPGSSHNDNATSSQPKSISALSYAKELYEQQGIAPFYAGIETSAFQSATEKALYFFAYTAFKNVYTFFAGNRQMGATVNLLLGCMAEWAHLPITLPLDCWTTQIQTGDNGNKGPLAILMTMLSEGDGIRGMYKGIQAYTILCLKPAIQYTVFEQIKSIMLVRKRLASARSSGKSRNQTETLSAMEAFLLGMFARTVATIVTFPYLRAKVVLQSQKKDDFNGDINSNSKPNIPSMIAKMYVSGGLGECFQGLGPELTRGVFSAALMMTMKEKISFVVRKALNE